MNRRKQERKTTSSSLRHQIESRGKKLLGQQGGSGDTNREYEVGSNDNSSTYKR